MTKCDFVFVIITENVIGVMQFMQDLIAREQLN